MPRAATLINTTPPQMRLKGGQRLVRLVRFRTAITFTQSFSCFCFVSSFNSLTAHVIQKYPTFSYSQSHIIRFCLEFYLTTCNFVTISQDVFTNTCLPLPARAHVLKLRGSDVIFPGKVRWESWEKAPNPRWPPQQNKSHHAECNLLNLKHVQWLKDLSDSHLKGLRRWFLSLFVKISTTPIHCYLIF